MFKYYLDRGLSSVEVLAAAFHDRTWWLPDLICDEVLETVRKFTDKIEFYQINDNFTWAAKINGSNPKVFYVIDYFGKECRLGQDAPPNTITIRDSVWFPYPFSPIESHHIWFNSLRKIFRGAKGSSIISPYRLSGLNEVPNIFYHPSLTWKEMNKRFENYYFCKEILSKYAVPDHEQSFPTVFPILLKNRQRVLDGLGTPLPGMWANKYKLPNPAYKQLTFIPIDSRFDKEKLTEIANKIMELA